MDILLDKLGLTEKPPLTEEPTLERISQCLSGTRADLLSDAKKWIDSNSSNILWILGSPGAGKTSFAFTIVNSLSRQQVVSFFSQGRAADPRTIWPSIARQLAELDRGIRFDLLEALKLDRRYSGGVSIKDQFRTLIYEPLKRHYPADSNPFWRVFVLIDAFVEGDRQNEKDWDDFMSTIIEWQERFKFSRACKLIIVGQNEADYTDKLGETCHTLVLGPAKNADIRLFFEAEFREAFGDRGPGWEAINRLTDYASGSFAWASTVAGTMTRHPGPKYLQLGKILEEMSTRDSGDRDTVGDLCAQILFMSLRNLGLETRGCNCTSLVLASLVLLKDSFSKEVLLVLLAPFDADEVKGRALSSRSIRPSPAKLHDAIESLGTLIVADVENNNTFRVCHRSFSDFLLDELRVRNSVANLLDNSNVTKSERESIMNTFSLSRQHALLAERCLFLLTDSNLNKSYYGSEKREEVGPAFAYARNYWIYHSREAGAEYHKSNPKNPKNFPKLQGYTVLWLGLLGSSSSLDVDETIERLASPGSVPLTLAAIQDSLISHITSTITDVSCKQIQSMSHHRLICL